MWSKAGQVGVNTPVFSVTYDPNGSTGGDVPKDMTMYKSGSVVTVPDNILSLAKTGYSFTGWNTLPDGTGTTYTIGEYFTMGSSNVTLYARWVNTTVSSVTFNDNGSTGGSAPFIYTMYEPGQSVFVPGNPGSLVKAGYAFTGWNTMADGSGITYSTGQSFNIAGVNVILYARWSVSVTYAVIYDKNGADGGSVPLDTTNYISGQNAAVLPNSGNLAKTGYNFTGWNTAADGSGFDYVPAGIIVMTSNIILYAKWGVLPPAAGMVAEYTFSGNADDTSGNAFNGIVNGAVISADRFGNINSSYSFDGNDYIQLPASNTIIPNTLSSYSISFWFKLNTFSTTSTLISAYDGASDNTYFVHCYLDNNSSPKTKLFNEIRSSAVSYAANSSETMDDNSWHHAVIVVDKSLLYSRVYIDNHLENSISIPNVSFIDNGVIRLGVTNTSSLINYYNGLLDDMRIYDRVLAASDISDLYHENSWKDKVLTPVFDIDGGFYQGAKVVSISCATSGADIYYTQDGSEPTQASLLYSGPINIPMSTSVTIKARAFKTGFLDSVIRSQSYSTIADYIIQPGPSDGSDAFVCSSYDIVFETFSVVYKSIIRTGGWGDEYRALIRFDVTTAPLNPASVKLYLFAYDNPSAQTTMYMDDVTSNWTESTVKWSNKPTFTNITTLPLPVKGSWYIIDVTASYNQWKISPATNYGLGFRPLSTSNTWTSFYSSDFPDDPSLRPALIITP